MLIMSTTSLATKQIMSTGSDSTSTSSPSTSRIRQGGNFCGAFGCLNARYKSSCQGKHFFTFPKDEPRCQKWIQNTRREDLKGLTAADICKRGVRICNDHFENNQFTVPTERKRLNWNDVPTLFDVPNPPALVTPKRKSKPRPSDELPTKKQKTASTENHTDNVPVTIENDSNQDVEKVKKKLAATRSKLYRQNKHLEGKRRDISPKDRQAIMLEELAKHLPQRTYNFIAKQLAMFHPKKMGRRWSESDKTLALSLFHASRKAYRLFKKLFVLPSVSTLRKTMRDISVYPGFNENILQALAQKVKALGEGAEVCSFVFDEMSIKEWVNYNKENDNIEGL